MDESERLKKALTKKALGYNATEVVEEYLLEDGKQLLSKKKVTKKHFSPDVSALKLLLEKFSPEMMCLSKMTDQQLIASREKILKILKEEDDGN